jgi:hypothetical protein
VREGKETAISTGRLDNILSCRQTDVLKYVAVLQGCGAIGQGADTTSLFFCLPENKTAGDNGSEVMASRKISQHPPDKPVVPTGGKFLSDGPVLELIRIPSGELNFLIWNGKSARTTAQFIWHDETFVPLRVDPAILRSLHLPSNIAGYGSTRKLFTEISTLISRVTQAGDGVVLLLTFYVFATWLADCLPIAPFVWIIVPPTTTASPLAQLLSLLCRHAFAVNDISSARFHSLPMDLQPTLLTEVFRPTRRVLNLLRASNRHGAFVAAGGKAIDPFCAKIVFAPEPLRDPASAGFPLELVLTPTREYVPLMNSSEAARVGAEFQAKLLHYRLLNWAKVRTPAFDLSQFTVPVQELAYSLAASIVDDDELQSQIVPFLTPLDREVRVDLASQLPAIVLEALLARCHSTTGQKFPVGDLTADVNTILRGRKEMLEVSPEEIGWALRRLGLHRGFISGGRKGVVLQSDVRQKIHDLAAGYGVHTLRELPAKIDCPLCAALGLPWKFGTHGHARESK